MQFLHVLNLNCVLVCISETAAQSSHNTVSATPRHVKEDREDQDQGEDPKHRQHDQDRDQDNKS